MDTSEEQDDTLRKWLKGAKSEGRSKPEKYSKEEKKLNKWTRKLKEDAEELSKVMGTTYRPRTELKIAAENIIKRIRNIDSWATEITKALQEKSTKIENRSGRELSC